MWGARRVMGMRMGVGWQMQMCRVQLVLEKRREVRRDRDWNRSRLEVRERLRRL
jgi:hypothetical protein